MDAGRIVVRLVADTSQYTGAMQAAAKSSVTSEGVINNSFGGIAKAARTLIAGVAVKKIIDFGKESLIVAGQVQELEIVNERMAKNAGIAATAVSKEVKEVKKLGITSRVANNSLSKLLMAQLDMTKASDLARVAQDAAVVSQTNSSEAYDRLIHGITTYNPLILRRLGIIIDSKTAFENHAKAVGKDVSQLTSAEKQSAYLNAVLEQGTKIYGLYEDAMTSASKQIRSWPRYIEEIQEAIGTPLQPIFSEIVFETSNILKGIPEKVAPIAESFARAWEDAFKKNPITLDMMMQDIDTSLPDPMQQAQPVVLTQTEQTLSRILTSASGINSSFGDIATSIGLASSEMGIFATLFDGVATVIEGIAAGVEGLSLMAAGDWEGLAEFHKGENLQAQDLAREQFPGLSEDPIIIGDVMGAAWENYIANRPGLEFGLGLGKQVLEGMGQGVDLGLIESGADTVFGGVWDSVTAGDGSEIVSSGINEVIDAAASEIDPSLLEETGKDVAQGFEGGFIAEDVVGLISDEASGWVSTTHGYVPAFFDTGSQFSLGLAEGISSNAGVVAAAARAVVRAAVAAANAEADTGSPSRVFAEIGGNLMYGLEQGIEKIAYRPIQSVEGVIGQMINYGRKNGLESERTPMQIHYHYKDTTLDLDELYRTFEQAERLNG